MIVHRWPQSSSCIDKLLSDHANLEELAQFICFDAFGGSPLLE